MLFFSYIWYVFLLNIPLLLYLLRKILIDIIDFVYSTFHVAFDLQHHPSYICIAFNT